MSEVSLWEIDQRLRKAFIIPETGEGVDVETGELFDKEYMDSLNIEFDKKLKNIFWWIKELDADIEKLAKQKKMVSDWQKTLNNRRNSLAKYAASVLDGRSWQADDMSCKAGWRMSRDVVTVDDVKQIPLVFFKTAQTEGNLNKTAVKQAILDGCEVPGVHLQDNNNIQIK